MTITHIMKDGRVLDSIEGYVVTMKDCPQVYNLIDRLNQEGAKKRYEKTNKEQNFEDNHSDSSDSCSPVGLLCG